MLFFLNYSLIGGLKNMFFKFSTPAGDLVNPFGLDLAKQTVTLPPRFTDEIKC